MSDPTRKLRIAVAGCGRMGKRHARNVAYYTPRAELVALSDPQASELDYARENFPASVKLFTSTEEMIALPEVEAILITTETAAHADLAQKAIRAGKHVLLEKPISISLEESAPFVELAAAHPELKVMMGFSRRYDESYNDANAKIQEGLLGRPYYIKSSTNDMFDSSGFFVAYARASGAIFLDCGIHDIDISRWLLDVANPKKLKNPKKQVTSVYASGTNVHHPELAEMGDCDNGYAIIEYENGTKCSFHLSRTAQNGHDTSCEIYGSDAKLTVNWGSNLNRNEIRDKWGVRTESTPTYYERFQGAFVREVNTFTESVLDDKPILSTPADGLAAAEIAVACTHSFRTGRLVFFDDEGKPILD